MSEIVTGLVVIFGCLFFFWFIGDVINNLIKNPYHDFIDNITTGFVYSFLFVMFILLAYFIGFAIAEVPRG